MPILLDGFKSSQEGQFDHAIRVMGKILDLFFPMMVFQLERLLQELIQGDSSRVVSEQLIQLRLPVGLLREHLVVGKHFFIGIAHESE